MITRSDAAPKVSIESCELEAGAQKGQQQLIVALDFNGHRLRFRIESSRSWRPVFGQAPLSDEHQRSVDAALWAYLQNFTGEIDARLLARPPAPSAVSKAPESA